MTIVFILIITNIILDYVSNYCTVSLLYVAENCRSWADAAIVGAANILATITIFTWIFPLGLVCCVLSNVFYTEDITFQISITGKPYIIYSFDSNDNSVLWTVRVQAASKDNPGENDFDYLRIIYPHSDESSILLQNPILTASKAIEASNENTFIYRNAGIVTSNVRLTWFGFNSLSSMYYSAFDFSEVVRQRFSEILLLRPLALSLSGLYSKVAKVNLSEGETEWRAECESGEIFKFSGPILYDNITQEVKQICGGSFNYAVSFDFQGSINERLRSLGAARIPIPIAAFFLSSFAISVIYYIGIAITAFGLLLNRSIGSIFRSSIIRGDEIPFIVLATLCFFPLEAVWLMLS